MSYSFSHLIEMNDKEDRIIIYRIFDDGRKQLYTHIDFSDISFDADRSCFDLLAKELGENLLLDSPVARKKFKI